MGGQETLLLAALHPKLLTAAAPLDSATDMAAHDYAFATTPGEAGLCSDRPGSRSAALRPQPQGVRRSSPISYVHQLATEGVPLDIWWSRRDKIVADQ